MEEWLDAALPDFGSTPRQVLNSGDHGTLALLDRSSMQSPLQGRSVIPVSFATSFDNASKACFENRGRPMSFTGT